MADLGFSPFYFSCQKYYEITQARIIKVAGFFYNKSNKIGCAFFLIFVRFYTNFQSFSKNHLLFKMRFYWQVPATSVSIANRSLVHEKHPGINEREAM
jgi:hypothetical protein